MRPPSRILRSDDRTTLCKLSILALLIYGSAVVVVLTLVRIGQSISSMSGQDIALLLAGRLAPLATLLSIFAGSLAAGLAGFAFSAISGAMLFHWLAPIDAVPLLLACSITTQLFSISRLWHTMRWRQCFPYLAGGFAGIPVGAKLLEGVSPHTFAAGFGVFLICYSVYMLLRPHFTCRSGGRWAEIAVGFAGGSREELRLFQGRFQPFGATSEACRNWSSAELSNHSFCSCKSQRSFIFQNSAYLLRQRGRLFYGAYLPS